MNQDLKDKRNEYRRLVMKAFYAEENLASIQLKISKLSEEIKELEKKDSNKYKPTQKAFKVKLATNLKLNSIFE